MRSVFARTMVVLAAVGSFAGGGAMVVTSLNTALEARFRSFLESQKAAEEKVLQTFVPSVSVVPEELAPASKK